MSRYFCILSLLLYFHITFCYHYFNDDITSHKVKRITELERKSKPEYFRTQGNKEKYKRHNHIQVEKEPVAQFDVANFIGNSYSEDNFPFGQKDGNELQNFKHNSDYGNLINFYSDRKENDVFGDYLDEVTDEADEQYSNAPKIDSNNFKLLWNNNQHLPQTTSNKIVHNHDYLSKNMYQEGLVEGLQQPGKKGGLRNLRFPFFSHNKLDTSATTKDKKRKLFPIKKTKTGKITDVTKENGLSSNIHENEFLYASENPVEFYKLNKRSYQILLCPECKKRYTNNYNSYPRQMRENGIIHNSRQFFQGNFGKSNTKNLDKPNNDGKVKCKTFSEDDFTDLQKTRRKRQDMIKEKQRQMKELDEVERKVESVEINTSMIKLNNANKTLSFSTVS